MSKNKKVAAIIGVVTAIVAALAAFGVDMPSWVLDMVGNLPAE